MWDAGFRIGDGEKTTDETATPVYRDYYTDCDIEMTAELFRQISRKFNIYFSTTILRNIQFTPKTQIPQTSSNYYFLHLDIKFPRNKI